MKMSDDLRAINLPCLLAGIFLLVGGWSSVLGVDCNRNRSDDGRDLENGLSEDCDGNGVPDECDVSRPVFDSQREDIGVASVPVVVLAEDFDGDGDVDIASGSEDSTLVLLLNQGEREFSTETTPNSGAGTGLMSAGDFDGDGDLDLVTNGGRILHVLRLGEDHRFEPLVRYTTGAVVEFLTAIDVSRDGYPDLITAETSGSIAIRQNLGDGSGTFAEPIEVRVASKPGSIATADFDGDGDVDLAVGHARPALVSVLANDGSGHFPDRRDQEFTAGPVEALLARDMDGDGDQDLFVVTGSKVVLLSNNGAGDLSILRTVRFGRTLGAVVAEDLDADGDVDLAVSSSNERTLTLILNDGTGRFGGRQELNPGILQGRRVRRGTLLARDLDGDGGADLGFVVAPRASKISLLWSSDDALSFAPPFTFLAKGPPHTTEVGDLDGDGDLDVIVGLRFIGGPGAIVFLRNHGDGTLGEPETATGIGLPISIAAVDLDNDGDVDLTAANLETRYLTVIENLGGAEFRRAKLLRTPGLPIHVAVADLNGDDAPDLVSSNTASNNISLFFNHGDVTFRHAENIRVGSVPSGSVASDFDGDGDFDLVVANQGSAELSFLENLGEGSFAPAVQYPLSGPPRSIAVGDFDLDGNMDVATLSEQTRKVAISWNSNGNGNFSTSSIFSVGQVPFSLITADMDSDGALDIVATNSAYNSVSILLNRRDFLHPIHLFVGVDPRLAVAGDLDRDGDMDLVSSNRQSLDVMVFLNELATPVTYLESVCTDAEFAAISVARAGGTFRERATKYTVPARDDPELLSTVFQNAKRFPLHQEFLGSTFPEVFPLLTPKDYDELVGRRATRGYYVGSVEQVRSPDGILYTFTVFADTGSSATEALSVEEVARVYETLRASFLLGPLSYQPDTELARQTAEEWRDPPFPVFFGDGRAEIEYEPYTLGTGYGRVRRFTLEQLESEIESGCFTEQDILVLEQAPRDVEGIIGGMVTAGRQGPLSHLSVRLARRGTPNAYVPSALEDFEPFEDRLVRLDVLESGYVLEQATLEEAEEFWAGHRPLLPDLPAVDAEYATLDLLAEMDFGAVGDEGPEARFGGKASNFARLQHTLTGDFARYREPGFAIPMHYYLEFMRTNTIPGEGGEMTYQEHLDALFVSAEFRGDCRLRQEALDAFRSFARENGTLDPDLVGNLTRRIPEVFGATTRMVRFRSSSNIEDSFEFNGAGLYESTSVCAEDTLDTEVREGSHCDPTRSNERRIERALKKVWTSLWTYRAFEERSFFQIPHESAAMGILVSRAFLDERANGVAFTGNPTFSGDRRYVVTAQVGEESVVNPKPGVSVERTFLEVVDGKVVDIIRDRSSSLVEGDELVLTDEQLRELGDLMAFVDQNFSLDLQGREHEKVLLDFEFKIVPDGSVAIKQVRPFLVPDPAAKAPTFQLEVPAATSVCGAFSRDRTGREPVVEYETKSVVHFREGVFDLPTRTDSFAADLIDQVRFGPNQDIAQALGPGEFKVVRIPAQDQETIYRFTYTQRFELPGGQSFEISIFRLDLRGRGDVPVERVRVLDEEFLTFALAMEGRRDGSPVASYSSCSQSLLPLWKIDVETDDDLSVIIEERFLPSENDFATGPASLIRADVELAGLRQTITDYWDLVYSARRHNVDIRYMIILDPPLSPPGTRGQAHAIEVEMALPMSDTAKVRYLGADFEVLGETMARSVERQSSDESTVPLFRRGDVTSDGSIDVTDSIALLRHLFASASESRCVKAADADDSGRVTVTDAIRILLHLFRNHGPLPEPFDRCGVDPSSDGLSCESFDGCDV